MDIAGVAENSWSLFLGSPFCLLRLSQKAIAAMRATPSMPPMTPPAIAPACDFFGGLDGVLDAEV
jgi:hypothetical protein